MTRTTALVTITLLVLAIGLVVARGARADLGLWFASPRAHWGERVEAASPGPYATFSGVQVYLVPMGLARSSRVQRPTGPPHNRMIVPIGQLLLPHPGVARLTFVVPRVRPGDYTLGFWCKPCAPPEGAFFTTAQPGQRWTPSHTAFSGSIARSAPGFVIKLVPLRHAHGRRGSFPNRGACEASITLGLRALEFVTHHGVVRCLRLRIVIAGAALATGVFVASPAQAAIVPGRGIAGIMLRMTQSQVRAKLGSPTEITRWRGALGSVVTRLHYPRVEIDFEKLGRVPVVVRVLTTLRSGEETASGVGVGATLASVKRLKGAHCWWGSANHYCGIGNREKPLSRFTMFWINAKHQVMLVSISLIVNG